MNKGIVYIIGGEKYAKWTLKSVLSLRQNGGKAANLPIHIHFIGNYQFIDQFNQLGCTGICHQVDKVSHHAHRKLKSIVMQETPFERYIMIDADTFIQGDFYEMFDLIPEDGVAGIEDGNFESHLQMAKFLFLSKHANKKNAREITKELLGVDYGTDENYPPYYNVGVIGFSAHASKIIGKELYPLLIRLSHNKLYNQHDEQLPMNAIMYNKNIKGIAIDPKFNYTRSRMKNNKKKGIHDKVKFDIRIIHNRHYPKECDWIDTFSINNTYKQLIHDSK